MSKIDLTTRELMLESIKHYAKNKIPFDFIREHDAKNLFPQEIIKDLYKHEGCCVRQSCPNTVKVI